MNPSTPAAPADPVLLLIALCWIAAEAVAVLLIAAAALALALLQCSMPPARLPAAPAPAAASEPPPPPAPLPAAPSPGPLEGLTVAQLRKLARAAGLPQLGRSGRRSELLLALAAAPG